MRTPAVILGTLALLLCGCGTKDKPAPYPLPSSSSSHSSKPAKKLSPEQTVRAWVAGYNKLARTGDSTAVSGVTAIGCKACSNLTSPIVRTIKAGGAYRGGAWTVKRVAKAKATHKGASTVDTYVLASAGATRDRRGEPFKSFAADRYLLEFDLVMQADRWHVSQIVWLSS